MNKSSMEGLVMVDRISAVGGIAPISLDTGNSINPIQKSNETADGTAVDTSTNIGDSDSTASDQSQSDGKDTVKKKFSEEDLSKLSKGLNAIMEEANCNIEFKYSKELKRLTMQVVDKNTNKIIKEFPPQKMLDVLTGIREWLGVFLDKKI